MPRARIAIVVLLLGVVLAGAVGGGAWLYFRPAPKAPVRKAAPRPKPLPMVLTASKDLKLGSLITANDIAWSPLKNGVLLSAHLLKGKTNPNQVIGAVVRRAVFKDAPLTWSSIVRPGQYGFLAAALRPDHRAVTISVNRATSQAGLIYPGDRVDVILTVQVKEGRNTETFTGTILEHIRVVAVDRQVESSAANTGQSARKSSRNAGATVTLEVLPAEAERLILATSKGNISLAIRSLTDARRHDDRTRAAIENLLSRPPAEAPANPAPVPASREPAPVAEEPAPVAEEPEPVRVQIFRGTAREEVLLER